MIAILDFLSVFIYFCLQPSCSLVCIFLSTSLFAGQKVSSWIFSCCVLAIYLGANFSSFDFYANTVKIIDCFCVRYLYLNMCNDTKTNIDQNTPSHPKIVAL